MKSTQIWSSIYLSFSSRNLILAMSHALYRAQAIAKILICNIMWDMFKFKTQSQEALKYLQFKKIQLRRSIMQNHCSYCSRPHLRALLVISSLRAKWQTSCNGINSQASVQLNHKKLCFGDPF